MKTIPWRKAFIGVLTSGAVIAAMGVLSGEARAELMGPSGGAGGIFFSDTTPAAPFYLSSVTVRHGALVDAIRTHWYNPNTGRSFSNPQRGGGGGTATGFTVRQSAGEHLYYISGTSDRYVNSLTLCTRGGTPSFRCSPRFGGSGGGYYYYQAPAGYEIAGFMGRSGALVDAIGVVIRRR